VKLADIIPEVTLLIPAYNEEIVIAAKINNSLALDYPAEKLQVVVVADGSTDGTVSIASGFQSVEVCYQPERRGKGAAVNRIVPMLASDIIVITDANSMLSRGTLRALVRNFADPTVGAVAGEKHVRGGGEGLYWRYESYLKRCDSAVSSVMGAAGELFAIRREVFQPPEEDPIIEDFVMSMRLVGEGWRVVYESEAVASEVPSGSLKEDWERRARNAAGGFQAISRLRHLLNPRLGLVSWQYLSHRVLRWAVTPFLLPTAYLLNLLLARHRLYRLLLLGQTLFYGAAIIGYLRTRNGRRSGLLNTVFYFCFSNLAIIAGFWRYIGGRQPVTWEKAKRETEGNL
jgi:cellulose synthase/poly-beta-1,6-N-acetylglucosamine synthase-like glycosyltransferase